MHIRHTFLPPLALLAFIAALCGIMASCGTTAGDNRLTVSVSIEPLRRIVEAVAGDKADVVTLMPQGASPETYEPTPRQMMELGSSRLLMRVGSLGFERTSLPKMAASNPSLDMVDLGTGLTMLQSDGHTHDGDDGSDPHLWMSAANQRTMAANACEALCRADSANAGYYRQRMATFIQTTNQLDAELAASLKAAQHRTFLIYHPALGYFARDYGLRQLPVELDGKEPSAARMRELLNTCRAAGVTTVFVSKEHAGRAARRMASELKARLVEINPLDYDTPTQMRAIAKALQE